MDVAAIGAAAAHGRIPSKRCELVLLDVGVTVTTTCLVV
jgi:hypothetical protein